MNSYTETVLTDGYGLKDTRLTLLRTTGGGLKHLWRAESAGGPAYVLKRYGADFRSERDLDALCDCQAYLRAAGFPVPQILPDREGRFTHGAHGSNWVLYDAAPGRHLDPRHVSPRAAAELGETLGRLHLRLRTWKPGWTSPERLEVFTAEEGIPLCERLLRHAEQGRTLKDEQSCRMLRHAIAGLHRLAGWAPRILAMEQQWLHGDVNEGNFFFSTDDRVSGIIDFDNVREAPRGFDFMYGLASFFPAMESARDEYARAYLRTVRPPLAELELYGPLWELRQVCDIWPIDLRYLNPGAYDERWNIPEPKTGWDCRSDLVTDWLLRLA